MAKKSNFTVINEKSFNLFKKYNDADIFGTIEGQVDIVRLKQNCLEKAIRLKETQGYGRDAFLKDYAKRVALLMDSRAFQEWCKEKGVSTFSAATHVVHLGVLATRRAIFDDIIEFGSPQLEFYPEWNTPLFGEAELLGRLAIHNLPDAAPQAAPEAAQPAA